jgi:hypothetical protein
MEGSTYTHSTAPKPVRSKVKRTTYRDENEENIVSNNIMFDRRVVRGNTYAAQVVTQNAHREVERLRTENERTLKHETRCRRKGELGSPAAPPAVKSRANIEAQTDTFLEELSDRPIEMQIATQTESFMDRPPSPLFIPSKTGVDKETEIPPGDLFNFDLEVKPVLEVLVGKTLRSSMLEVVEEEELIAIQRRQREFEQMRNAEFIEVQRLDAEASRRFAEKQRRVAQEKERHNQQAELQEKVAARAFAKSYLVDLSEAVFDHLQDTGHFYDPVDREIRDCFLPWLLNGVVDVVNSYADSRGCADALISDSIDMAVQLQTQVVAEIVKQEADAANTAEAPTMLNEDENHANDETKGRDSTAGAV